MIHNFYMGETQFPQPENFDIGVDSKTVGERIGEALAHEKVGDTLFIEVHTVEEGP